MIVLYFLTAAVFFGGFLCLMVLRQYIPASMAFVSFALCVNYGVVELISEGVIS